MTAATDASTTGSLAPSPSDIAFVFDDVADYQDLAAAFGPGVEVYVLDSTHDGLHQIEAILQGRSGIGALHIVGHGAAGTLDLGSLTLDSSNIGEHSDTLGRIGASLDSGGDILLYGCDVAAGAAGAQFVGSIAQATGADVAASTDPTGGAQLGGNWTLEYQTGPIAAHAGFNAAAVSNLDTLLATNEDVNPGMTTGPGHFVPGFTLATTQPVYDDPSNGVNGGIYFDTLNQSESFTVSADGSTVGSFDLAAMTWVKAFNFGEFTISITGHRADGSTATAVLYTAQNASTFSVTDSFSDMTGLTSFDVTITGTSTDAGAGSTPADLTLDAFIVNNILPPAPSAPQLTGASDTGFSNSDRITAANTVAFTGTGPAGDSTDSARVFIDKNNNGLYDAGTDVSGTSTLSNGSWSVSGLSTAGLADGTYKVYAQLSNAGGSSALSTPQNVTIDHTAPTVAITSDKSALKAGETANVTFTFSEDPGATFVQGDVQVTGGSIGTLTGSGTTRIATFTPTANTDSSTASITVSAGSYTDLAGNTGSSGVKNIGFDTQAPTLSITSDKTAMGAGDTATVTFSFSENPGATFDQSDISVTGGTLSNLTTSGTVRTATFTAGTGSTASISVTANSYSDAAGNTGAGATSATISLDMTPPDPPSTPALAAGNDTGRSSTDNLTKLTTPTLSGTAEAGSTVKLYDGATLVGSGTADGSGHWSIATSSLADGTHSITAKATDAAGNTGVASGALNLAVDATAPTVDAVSSDVSALKVGETAHITFSFSEDPGAFTAGNVSMSGGALGEVTGTGNTRTAIFTPDANASGTATVAVHFDQYTDAAGNTGDNSASLDIAFDTVAPSMLITSDAATLKAGETTTITFVFSKDPGTSFSWDGSAGDVTVTGGTLSALSGTGTTRIAVFTPDGNTDGGTASISVGDGTYTDSAGNAGLGDTGVSITFDTRAPDAPHALALAAGSDSGTAPDDGLTNVTTPTVSGIADGGTTVQLYDGATLVGSTTADGGGNWSIATTALAGGQHTMTAIALDVAGNVSTPSGSIDVMVDTSAPTLAITSDKAALIANETATITFTFSEDPGTTFTSADISVSGGALGAISGIGTMRTATFTPTAGTNGGTASITVAAGTYTDAAGNNGDAGTAPSLHFDTLAPAVTITSDAPTLKIGDTAVITFTFSEDPGASFAWDGTSGDVALTGGTLSAIVGTGTTRTAIFTPTANTEGVASITIDAGHYTDAAGNGGAAGTSPSLTFDTLAPSAPSTPALATGSDTGTSSSDHLTNVTTPTLIGTAEAGASVALYDGTRLIGSGSADQGGNWSITSDTLAAGIHTIVAIATDAADNTGAASDPLGVTIDTTPPMVLIESDKAALIAHQTATITFTFSEDPGSAFTKDAVSVSGGTLAAVSGSGLVRTAVFTPDDHASGTATITLGAGSYGDGAGNAGENSSLGISFDTAPPTVLISSSQSALKIGETATITFTFSEDPGASFTSGDVVVSGGTLGALSGDGLVRSAVFTPTENTNGGTANITIESGAYMDAAGNGGGAGLAPPLTFDTLAPTAPGGLDLTDSSDTGASNTDNITSDRTPTLAGTAEDGATVTLYDSDGTTVLGTTTATGGSWFITTGSALSDGVHDFSARATDAAGNSSSLSEVLSVTIQQAAVTVRGSGQPDLLVGGSGDDTLDGGMGADTMVGGAGDDTYFVDNRGDTIIEQPGGGVDQVFSKVSIVLPANVENVTLEARGHSNATGNELDNVIIGNAFHNILTGGRGADTITGGLGHDRFVYLSTADSTPTHCDVITDFSSAQHDVIDLRAIDAKPLVSGHQAFTFIGTAAFSSTDATGQLRFDPTTHMLYGSTNVDSAPEFAIQLVGVTALTAHDFHL